MTNVKQTIELETKVRTLSQKLEKIEEYVESQMNMTFAVREGCASGAGVINELVLILGDKK